MLQYFMNKLVDLAARVLVFRKFAPIDPRLSESLGSLAGVVYALHDVLEVAFSFFVFLNMAPPQYGYKAVTIDSRFASFLEMEQHPVLEAHG